MFRIISGAVESAKKLHCSPSKALDDKFFSSSYWHWQHRYLIDAVKQFGYPTFFITISPYEWDFPMVSSIFVGHIDVLFSNRLTNIFMYTSDKMDRLPFGGWKIITQATCGICNTPHCTCFGTVGAGIYVWFQY